MSGQQHLAQVENAAKVKRHLHGEIDQASPYNDIVELFVVFIYRFTEKHQ